MPALESMDRDFLEFLCICAEKKIRVVTVKPPRRASLRRLRYAGFVSLDGFQPSPSALADFRARQAAKMAKQIPADTCAPEDSPAPAARDEGGAVAARSGDEKEHAAATAAPPKRNPARSMREKAERFEADRRAREPLSNPAKFVSLAEESDLASPASQSEAALVTPVETRPPLRSTNNRGAVQVANGEGPEPRPRPVHPREPRSRREQPTPDAAAPIIEYQGASGTAREASGAAGSPVASRIEDRAPLDEPAKAAIPSPAHPTGAELAAAIRKWAADNRAPLIRISLFLFNSQSGVRTLSEAKHPKDETIAKVRAFLDHPPSTDELPRRPPQNRPAYVPRPLRANGGALAVAQVRRTQTKRAQNWLDAGKRAEDAPTGLRLEIRAEEKRRVELARQADPVEQAKTIIRRKTRAPVFGAEYADPPGPKGKFFIGRRLVTKNELLAEAERLAAA